MALFSRTKKTDLPAEVGEKKTGATAVATPAVQGGVASGLAHVLRNPRITEKASLHTSFGAYLFDVATGATKQDIGKAVFALYKVKPRMIRVVTVPSKTKRSSRTGKMGIKQGGKKAYVYLKKGESITITQ